MMFSFLGLRQEMQTRRCVEEVCSGEERLA